ncbi:MFS transporter [Prauserella rugosa]|uniref:Putative proline/betaine transporter n=1 Tax=Prauserella rugosa TaxID=43354 RepID=A0A660CB98_9PSEU|nr:MFS transporter [Prauserella rugosa]TWH19604.1 putative MFS family arabinose efflux permease [Prauserella rugosa]
MPTHPDPPTEPDSSASAPASAQAEPDRRLVRRVALASSIGTMLEYYDFYLYGALSATIFGRLFFHAGDPAVGTLLALATFGVGFVARPLGGVIAGHFGDRVGRKAVLIATLALMGVSTAGIGLLPTYESIGTTAPLLLVVLRVLQGLAHGGEWGGAAIMTVEHAPQGRRAFYGTWPQMGVYAGIVVSNLVLGGFMLLPDEQFTQWGWRVPFLLGFVLVVVGLYLRRSITESPEFAAVKSAEPVKVPIVEALRTSGRGIGVTFGAKAAETGTFYLITVFALTLAGESSGAGENVALNGVLVASLVAIVAVGLFGTLADRIGRRRVYAFGAAFMGVFAFPFFWLAGTGSTTALWFALIAGLAIGHASMYGAQTLYFSELFDARVRYSGASLGYQLGAAVVGGFTPLIASALMLQTGGDPWPVAVYIVALCLVTVVVIGLWGQVRTRSTTEPVTDEEINA